MNFSRDCRVARSGTSDRGQPLVPHPSTNSNCVRRTILEAVKLSHDARLALDQPRQVQLERVPSQQSHKPSPVQRKPHHSPPTPTWTPGSANEQLVLPPGSSDFAVSRFLIGAIMRATTWQELQVLAQEHTNSFNHIHVSALVCRLPKLIHNPRSLPLAERTRFARFLGNVSDLVSLRLPSFDPRAVANVLWAVSKLGFSPAPPLLNKFLFEAYVRMYEFNGQELANLSWALATLTAMGNRPVTAWMHKFTQAALPKVASLKPQEVANMAWALSKLCPAEEQAAGRAEPFAAAPSSSSAQSAAAVVAAAVVGTSGPSASTAAPSGRQQHASSPAAPLGNVVPISRSRRSNYNVSSKNGSSSTDPTPGPSAIASSSSTANALPALVTALSHHAVASLPRFRCGELVMALAALYHLDPSASARLLRPALPHLLRNASSRSQSGELSGQDLANLWWVLEKCGMEVSSGGAAAAAFGAIEDGPARRARDGASASEPHQEHQHLRRQQQAASVQMLGRHHIYELMDLTERSVQQLTAQGLCMVLVAWAQLQLRVPASTASAVFQRLRQVLPTQASFQCVALTLWAAARLQLRPDANTMEMLESCARLQMASARPHHLVVLVWALQKLKYQPRADLVEVLSARLAVVARVLRPHALHIMISGYTMFGAKLPLAVREGAVAVAAAAAGFTRRPAAAAGAGAVSDVVDASAATMVLGRAPCVTVRFFATLVGVGVPKTSNLQRSAAAAMQLRTLRHRLTDTYAKRIALRNSLERATSGRLELLSTNALCALLTSMARLKLTVSAGFLLEVQAALVGRSATMAPWHVGAVLTAMARLGAHPSPGWMARMLAGLEHQYDALRSRQLIGVLRSLSKLRYRPSATWLRGYFRECMKRVDTLPVDCLGMMMEGLAKLGVKVHGKPAQRLQDAVYRHRGKLLEGVRRVLRNTAGDAGAAGFGGFRGVPGMGAGMRLRWRQAGSMGTSACNIARTSGSGLRKSGSSGGSINRGISADSSGNSGAAAVAGAATADGAAVPETPRRPRGTLGGIRNAARAAAARSGVGLQKSLCRLCTDLGQCRI